MLRSVLDKLSVTQPARRDMYIGRLRLIQRLHDPDKFSLSVGAGDTKFATVNIDIKRDVKPDIVASVFHLPFRDGIFESALFCDVLEHIPPGTERDALVEIKRVLNGVLLLTTPNNIPLFTYLDPAYYQVGHRHYDIDHVKTLLKETGFESSKIFASGGIWHMVYLLFRYLVYFRLKRILRTPSDITPRGLIRKMDNEYNRSRGVGYTIFAQATTSIPNTAST